MPLRKESLNQLMPLNLRRRVRISQQKQLRREKANQQMLESKEQVNLLMLLNLKRRKVRINQWKLPSKAKPSQ